MILKENKCSICGNNNGNAIIDRAFPRHEICKDCGFVYMNPIPDYSDNKAFYEEEYWDEHHRLNGLRSEYRESKRQMRMQEWLGNLFVKGNRLLEIGCGYGFNLDYLKKRNLLITVEGVEISAEGSHNVEKAFDITCYNTTIEEFENKDKYDFIIMCHVLEHFEHPEQVLLKAFDLLNENGVLWVEVPNIMFPNPTKNINKWLAKEHMSYFSPDKLRFLLEKTGFSINKEEHDHYVCFQVEKKEGKKLDPIYYNEYDDVKKALKRQKKLHKRYQLLTKFRIPSFTNYR